MCVWPRLQRPTRPFYITGEHLQIQLLSKENYDISTDGSWMRASQQRQTVPVHHWWRADEHLYAEFDILVQRLTIPGYESPLCSSLIQCVWRSKDILHSRNWLHLCTVYFTSSLSTADDAYHDHNAFTPHTQYTYAVSVNFYDNFGRYEPIFTARCTYSAKCGIANVSRPSVCLSVGPSVCNVEVPWSYKLGYFESICRIISSLPEPQRRQSTIRVE